ncbi:hypothetical protein [Salinibacter ruber]|jgi:hypothetical protein|uniref:hypothetical protein n=1 Tax=Salinibacter ruber TaxID=146919 RepID=UPI002168EA7A|nr:hypothetical protein [Salinibacter ruber]MCS3784710.1 hypothetical protein [Salinibacter ruber]
MPDSRPKTIQVFLPNGNPWGLRVARITSRTVQATETPRKKLSEVSTRLVIPIREIE